MCCIMCCIMYYMVAGGAWAIRFARDVASMVWGCSRWCADDDNGESGYSDVMLCFPAEDADGDADHAHMCCIC